MMATEEELLAHIEELEQQLAQAEQDIQQLYPRLAEAIRRYAARHYPPDIFKPDGKSPDAAAARFARSLCESLACAIERIAKQEEGGG